MSIKNIEIPIRNNQSRTIVESLVSQRVINLGRIFPSCKKQNLLIEEIQHHSLKTGTTRYSYKVEYYSSITLHDKKSATLSWFDFEKNQYMETKIEAPKDTYFGHDKFGPKITMSKNGIEQEYHFTVDDVLQGIEGLASELESIINKRTKRNLND